MIYSICLHSILYDHHWLGLIARNSRMYHEGWSATAWISLRGRWHGLHHDCSGTISPPRSLPPFLHRYILYHFLESPLISYCSSLAPITIANDVLTIPEDTPAKQRLSLSFAIAQSAVLAIFESRIDQKIVEYKYIPEHLAAHGKSHLNEETLISMIGHVS